MNWTGVPQAIVDGLNVLPAEVLSRSGKIFYTGREALRNPSRLYILGLNPGGDPRLRNLTSTIEKDLVAFHHGEARWSAYADESWKDRRPGTCGMQPRILHLLSRLNADPRLTPASNVVFVRSRREADLKREKDALLQACWPVHRAVIETLGVDVVVCMGKTAGKWVREQLGANKLVDSFKEDNDRGWTSSAHLGADGQQVITVTHPSIANWCNPDVDPTPLVLRALERAALRD